MAYATKEEKWDFFGFAPFCCGELTGPHHFGDDVI